MTIEQNDWIQNYILPFSAKNSPFSASCLAFFDV